LASLFNEAIVLPSRSRSHSQYFLGSGCLSSRSPRFKTRPERDSLAFSVGSNSSLPRWNVACRRSGSFRRGSFSERSVTLASFQHTACPSLLHRASLTQYPLPMANIPRPRIRLRTSPVTASRTTIQFSPPPLIAAVAIHLL